MGSAGSEGTKRSGEFHPEADRTRCPRQQSGGVLRPLQTASVGRRAARRTEGLRGRVERGRAAKGRALTLLDPSDANDVIAPTTTSVLALLKAILAPREDDQSSRISISVPDVSISGSTLTSFALLLHELTTNAAKYAPSSHRGTAELKPVAGRPRSLPELGRGNAARSEQVRSSGRGSGGRLRGRSCEACTALSPKTGVKRDWPRCWSCPYRGFPSEVFVIALRCTEAHRIKEPVASMFRSEPAASRERSRSGISPASGNCRAQLAQADPEAFVAAVKRRSRDVRGWTGGFGPPKLLKS
jgi:hypothetical protein